MHYRLEDFIHELTLKSGAASALILKAFEVAQTKDIALANSYLIEATQKLQECQEMYNLLLNKEKVGEKIPFSLALIKAVSSLEGAFLIKDLVNLLINKPL